MIELLKTYMPPAVCIVTALLIIAGVPPEIAFGPFVFALGISLIGYIHTVRDRFKRFDVHNHPMRRHDDHA